MANGDRAPKSNAPDREPAKTAAAFKNLLSPYGQARIARLFRDKLLSLFGRAGRFKFLHTHRSVGFIERPMYLLALTVFGVILMGLRSRDCDIDSLFHFACS